VPGLRGINAKDLSIGALVPDRTDGIQSACVRADPLQAPRCDDHHEFRVFLPEPGRASWCIVSRGLATFLPERQRA
jgi:hypothetical protein